MSDVEREQDSPQKPAGDESERDSSDEAPWETQDQPHQGEEGQSEETA
jgi:hypothetical protein